MDVFIIQIVAEGLAVVIFAGVLVHQMVGDVPLIQRVVLIYALYQRVLRV